MREFGDPGVLEIQDVPDPVPRAGEALVRVAAVEVSRTRDVAARGECVACRAGREYECARLEMVGIHRWGSYAELTTVPAGSLHVLPDGLELPEAAALAATGPIALTQLRVAAVTAGSEVLITGVTGALATVLSALASRLGARVTGLTRRVAVVAPGLRVTALDSGREDLTEAIRAAAGGAGDAVTKGTAVGHTVLRVSDSVA
jgi:D-arabinose 1-dehydrogenase-like Zn-dependent alcohol dehydrogenase